MAAAEELRVPLEPCADGHGGHGPGAERRNHRRQRHHAAHDAAGAQSGGGGARFAAGGSRPAVGRGRRAAGDARRRGYATRARRTAMPNWPARPNWRRHTKTRCPRVRPSRPPRTGRFWESPMCGWTRAKSSPARTATLPISCGRACSTAACCAPRLTGRRWRAADLSAAQKMPGVTAVRDGGFVGCAAPTAFAARKAVEAIAATAQWKTRRAAIERHAVRAI